MDIGQRITHARLAFGAAGCSAICFSDVFGLTTANGLSCSRARACGGWLFKPSLHGGSLRLCRWLTTAEPRLLTGRLERSIVEVSE